MLFSQSNENTLSSKLNKPNKLRKGDTVGIVSPATAVSSPDDIDKAKELLDYLELKGEFSKDFEIQEGYKTKPSSLRAASINSFFENKDIKGIISIRGGYGSMGILPYLDYDLIKKNPKIFVGYSDITAMHLAFNKLSLLSTLHGPMVLSSFSGNTIEYYKTALFTNKPLGKYVNPSMDVFRSDNREFVIKEGIAEGELTGGNLSLICSLIGTKYEIETKGRLLFIEDVGEEPYRIDRMLTQLNLAGKFKDIKGIVFGKCSECNNKSANPVWDYTLMEVLFEQFKNSDVPVMYGLLFGHTSFQFPIPYGVIGKINTEEKSLEIMESFCK
ncbi:MAG: hypothetical protein A2X64_04055 [Ignavibacteria bacterium GWF2_33_9]|nr:MAG: hypothetical protein A2X64_04055 [Ignavibacteria bacterium GWF2_33_9]